MDTLEYKLTLSTNEEIQIVEYDRELITELQREDIQNSIASILSLCTHINREILEKAKIGDIKPLEKMLRTPPYGCLLKIDSPTCSEIRSCRIADRNKCTTKYVVKKTGRFPFCWSYESGNVAANLMAIHIVNTWKDGKYAIIIE